jgi:osmotically-inducible protein OsmY
MKTDAELQQDVVNELEWEPTIDAAEIGVAVKDGVVTLSGYVDSYVRKWAAERAAARVFGVRAVDEEIQVRLRGSLKRSDEDIAGAVASVLEWNVLVPHDRVKVHVQDGLVTLSGEVDWGYQKFAAEEAVRYLMGVVWFGNQITVKPTVEPQNIKDKIVSAFQRNVLLDARRITVETRGGWVILRGSVRSWGERAEAQACPKWRTTSQLVPRQTTERRTDMKQDSRCIRWFEEIRIRDTPSVCGRNASRSNTQRPRLLATRDEVARRLEACGPLALRLYGRAPN